MTEGNLTPEQVTALYEEMGTLLKQPADEKRDARIKEIKRFINTSYGKLGTAKPNPYAPMTITIDDPDHVQLKLGAVIKVGNNGSLKEAGLGTMPGIWQVVHVHAAQEGKQRYDVESAGINRHHIRQLAARKK